MPFPPDLPPLTLAILAAVAMVGGCMDAIAGGGGLITMPAVLMAGLPPHLALGTNKGQAIFGPGTGILHILGGLWLLGQLADQASAEAKIANFGSNIGAFVVFALAGKIIWPVAAVMAIGQFTGGWIGAHALMRIGPEWVRRVGVVVCFGLMVKVGWDWFHPAAAPPNRQTLGAQSGGRNAPKQPDDVCQIRERAEHAECGEVG